ncbi:MAG: hypothetical protein OXT09_26425 [Myxococcales bacterium]|nr:hypothetical protein [Myxococcales bacterium]
MKSLAHVRPGDTTLLTLLALLPVLGGCDSQVAPGYRGEALLTIAGSVELESERERAPLRPALAFYDSERSIFHIVDVEVEGEFPADFVLRVFDPPPDSAIIETPERPASALGYITAVTEDHPDTVQFALQGTSTGACGPFDGEDGNPPCETMGQWCTADGAECYVESAICPTPDSSPDDCEITFSSGDPSLRRDPWESFAGISDEHRLIYLPEAVSDHPALSAQLGLRSLGAGYHLFESRSPTAEEQREALDCLADAEERAVERYNEEFDAELDVDRAFSGWGCAPLSDMAVPEPDSAGHADGGDGPLPDDSSCDDPLENVDHQALEELLDDTRLELQCASPSVTISLVEEPERERISVRIGLDVAPAF